MYCNVELGFLTVSKLISATRCLGNQYSQHSPLFEGQFQDFQNIMKYILSQWSLLNLVSWPTPYWFLHWPLFEDFDSSWCLYFHFLQIADGTQGLPKIWCGVIHQDWLWMPLTPAVWHMPYMIYGSSMPDTRFQRPQVMIAAPVSSRNLRKHYESEYYPIGHRYAQNDQAHSSNVRLTLFQHVGPCHVNLNHLAKVEKNWQSILSKANWISPSA
jgi:hypothetical protein